MSKVVFRFDIDSHKCIRDGVPILLDISERYNVPFTFFVNPGKAISKVDTLHAFFMHSSDNNECAPHLSAKEKLGLGDYLYAAIINPKMIKYKDNILRINSSQCELGLHGGTNHSHWYTYADKWSAQKVEEELKKGIALLRKIIPDYKPDGFAAPGFVTSDIIEKTLLELGFKYSSNHHNSKRENPVHEYKGLKTIDVNLCGEPGGIAFFEFAQAAGWSEEDTIDYFMNVTNQYTEVVVFDHPYFAAIQKKALIEKIVQRLLSEGHEIVTMRDLLVED